jgi:LPXTG-motif cell wall-anchored protein
MSDQHRPHPIAQQGGTRQLTSLARRLLAATAVSVAVVAMGSVGPVEAAGNLAAGSTTLSPGGSTTVTATFTGTTPFSISIVVSGGTAGTLAISNPTNRSGGIGAACIVGPDAGPPPTPAGEMVCAWLNTSFDTGAVTVTLTASPDASGVFQVAAIETLGQTRTTVATQNITVTPPPTTAPTTTTTAPPTTAPPTTAGPTTTLTGSGGAAPTTVGTSGGATLPATGNADDAVVWIALALTVLGGGLVALTRRRASTG